MSIRGRREEEEMWSMQGHIDILSNCFSVYDQIANASFHFCFYEIVYIIKRQYSYLLNTKGDVEFPLKFNKRATLNKRPGKES